MDTATTSDELDDASILHDLQEVLQRLSSLWEIGLTLVGADRKMPSFSGIFNVVINIMLDVITEEWKWSRLESNKTPFLSTDTIGKLLDSVIKIQPERFEFPLKEGLDLAMTRRLCVLEAIPKLYGLINIFYFYQTNIEMIVEKLLYAVIHQAEKYANLIGINKITFAQKAIWQRLYGISIGLMCEIYKAAAYRDMSRIRETPELIGQYQYIGRIKCDHVLDYHQAAMRRMQEMADIIFESKQKSQEESDNYLAFSK